MLHTERSHAYATANFASKRFVYRHVKKILWFFITLLLVSKAKTMLAKQSCCIQTKLYICIDYIEKWPFMVIFLYNLQTFLFGYQTTLFGPYLKSYFWNDLIIRFQCTTIYIVISQIRALHVYIVRVFGQIYFFLHVLLLKETVRYRPKNSRINEK